MAYHRRKKSGQCRTQGNKEAVRKWRYNFQLHHTRITGEGLDGEPINKVVYSTLAYKWFKNMKFVLGNDSTLNSEEKVSLMLDSIPLSDMKNQQSLCYVTGCITHQNGNEGVYVDFKFAQHPNLRAKFTSKQYGGAANQYLSQKNNSSFKPAIGAAWMMNSDSQHRTYRNTKRTINNHLGEEIIEASTEKSGEGYLTEINAVWYYPGELNSDDKPEVRFDLDYSYTTKQLPKDGAGFPAPTETDSIHKKRFMRYGMRLSIQSCHTDVCVKSLKTKVRQNKKTEKAESTGCE